MTYNEDLMVIIDNKLDNLAITVDNLEVKRQNISCLATRVNSSVGYKFTMRNEIHYYKSAQRVQNKQSRIPNFSSRLESVEKKQEEMLRLLTALRSELAGISSGMARRDSLMLGSTVVSGLSIRRDSLLGDQSVRRDSLILGSEFHGRSATIPVMEVEPWEPTQSVQEVRYRHQTLASRPVLQLLDQLFERQFILSPWVREKRMRNQLRLILKDYLEAGPKRRSTVTKLVHDAHQIFPIWRNQIREKVQTIQ